MVLKAVLTGDIVNSTKLKPVAEKKLIKILQTVLANYQFEFYRGDSFQVFVKNAEEALEVALLCRTAAISISKSDQDIKSDIRISIGIGMVQLPVKSLATAKGSAFVLSGRAFDEFLKTDDRLSIAVENGLANTAAEIISDYLNQLFKVMTYKQAEVIFELLQHKTQQEVAKFLKKSKSTINQHVMAGGWNEIEKLLQQYKSIVHQLS